ncbi:MAG: Ig domain-containing protein [Acidobacteriaceae bacterium]
MTSRVLQFTCGIIPDVETFGFGRVTTTRVAALYDNDHRRQLAPGLTLNAAARTISGTPSKVGTFTFTLSIADAENPPATTTQNYTIKVPSTLLTIDTTGLQGAGAGVPFTQTLAASGGVQPYTWDITTPGDQSMGPDLLTSKGQPRAIARDVVSPFVGLFIDTHVIDAWNQHYAGANAL